MKLNINTAHPDDSRTRKRTRDIILTTAYRMISRRGLFSAGIADLSKEAMVTRRTVYNYYETMDDLCADLHPLVLDHYLNILEAAPASPDERATEALYNRLVLMNSILEEDRELLNYFVHYDRYSARKPGYFNSSGSWNRFLTEKSGLSTILSRITDKPESDSYVTQRLGLLVESFIAFEEQINYRDLAFRQEGISGYQNFNLYARHITAGLIREG